jgi:hypothetical protein
VSSVTFLGWLLCVPDSPRVKGCNTDFLWSLVDRSLFL